MHRRRSARPGCSLPGRSRRLLNLVGGLARARHTRAVLRQLLGRDDLAACAPATAKRDWWRRCSALAVKVGADPARGSPAAHTFISHSLVGPRPR